jgi:hypothetical protein
MRFGPTIGQDSETHDSAFSAPRHNPIREHAHHARITFMFDR